MKGQTTARDNTGRQVFVHLIYNDFHIFCAELDSRFATAGLCNGKFVQQQVSFNFISGQ